MKFGTDVCPKAWGVDVQDTFFDSGKKCVAMPMVTAYYGQKMGENLASRTTSSLFDRFSWNLAQMFVLGFVDVQDIFFDSGRKCVAMVTAYYGQKIGENLASRTTSSVLTYSHGMRHRCLPWGVDVQDTVFDSGRKCVAMVTIYYGEKMGGESCVANYFLSFWPILLEFGTDVCLGV